MASKKTGRLAGLAALAGAAYLASKGKEGKAGKADRDDADRYTGSRASKEDEAVEEGESAQSKFRKAELEAGDIAAMAPRKVAPVKTAAAAEPKGAMRSIRSAVSAPSGSGGGRGPAVGEEEAYRNPASLIPGSSPAGWKGGETESTDSRASRIPGSSPAGWKGGEGERADSTELGRNINAALMGRGTGMATAGKIGAEALTAKGALARAAEAKRVRDAISGGAVGYKKGGAVKKMASGGMTSSASKRADGIATKGKTRGKMC